MPPQTEGVRKAEVSRDPTKLVRLTLSLSVWEVAILTQGQHWKEEEVGRHIGDLCDISQSFQCCPDTFLDIAVLALLLADK